MITPETITLNELLKQFYTIVEIRISIFDNDFRLVTEYPESAPKFCRFIRRTEAGREACNKCDIEACMRAKKLKKPHTYVCHAGLTEAITPIQLDSGTYGYAILAHILPQENLRQTVEQICTKVRKYGMTREECMQALSEFRPRTAEQINASVKILDAIASYIYIHNFIRWENENIGFKIDEFIRKNLQKKLTSDTLCNQFHCSRSCLYRISMKNFGEGIGNYITRCRLEQAKKMILSGHSISETTEQCGFSDYNYFCKVFKKHTGVSPSKFKSSQSKTEKDK